MAVDAKVVAKIQALLERSKRGAHESYESYKAREGEIANATALAQKLLRDHNLEIHEVEKIQGEGTGVDVTRESFLMADRLGYQPYRWMVTLGDAIAKTSFCSCVFNGTVRTLTFIGRPGDIAVAKMLYEFVRDQIKELGDSESRRQTMTHPLAFKAPFLTGCADRVHDRILEDFERAKREERGVGALVLVHDVRIKEYMVKHFPKLRNASAYHVNAEHFGAYYAGRAAGERVQIHNRQRVED